MPAYFNIVIQSFHLKKKKNTNFIGLTKRRRKERSMAAWSVFAICSILYTHMLLKNTFTHFCGTINTRVTKKESMKIRLERKHYVVCDQLRLRLLLLQTQVLKGIFFRMRFETRKLLSDQMFNVSKKKIPNSIVFVRRHIEYL